MQALSRYPDVDTPDLTAVDAADRLILDEAADLITYAPNSVVIIDDNYGALTLGALDAGAIDVRTHQDLITGERALTNNATTFGIPAPTPMPLTSELVADASLVLLRLPRSLDRLAELSALIAAHAAPDVTVVAGGRIKHMSIQMNEILGEVFDRVDVSHARQKSRVLFARNPKQPEALDSLASWPKSQRHADLDLTVVAHGGVFAGTKLDIGTRFLLSTLDTALPDATTAVDLACGTGIVASWLAHRRPSILVIATDRSAIAAASARATAEANGVADRVTVTRADGLENLPDGSQELVILNPPFHSDATLSVGIAEHLFTDAARTLKPGGELWCVWNSHLQYRSRLQRIVGPTRQIDRNRKFTVTASTRV